MGFDRPELYEFKHAKNRLNVFWSRGVVSAWITDVCEERIVLVDV